MKVALLLADGFEEIEALGVVDILRRAEIDINTISISDTLKVTSARNISVEADKLFEDMNQYDMIILPGGKGAWILRDDNKIIELVKIFNNDNKYIAAICAAPMVLGKANILNNKNVTSYPDDEVKSYLKDAIYKEDAVVVDDKIITSRGPSTVYDFAYTLVDILGKDSNPLKEGMLYNRYIKK